MIFYQFIFGSQYFHQFLLSVGFQESIEQLQNVLKQNNPMGSHIPPGIPPLLAKNWQPVPDHPNSFRNKFTHQYTHKHIINIQSPLEIQSFKFRMKENNPYICRVLFYHQYHDSIYHVYTDQIHMQPTITTLQSWRTHRLKIFQSFLKLAETFGYMKVCRQMIGADTNGNIKIWIHPDPVSGKPWSSCNSESVMISQIQNILKTVEQRQKNKEKKNYLKSLQNEENEYFSFKQAIEGEKYLIQIQTSRPKSRARSSAINEGIQNQNNNPDSSNRKKNMNKTYNFGGRGPQTNQFITSHSPQLQVVPAGNQQTNGFVKQNKLQKMFNPILCQTSRQQDELNKFRENNKNKKGSFQRSNFSLQRPVSYYHAGFATEVIKNNGENSKNVEINDTKRRQTQNFKQIQNMEEFHASVKTQDKYSAKSKTLAVDQQAVPSNSHNKSAKNSEQKQKRELKKNPLNKIFAPARIYVSPNQINHEQKIRENKTYQGFNQSKPQSVTHKLDKGKLSSGKKQYKQTPMPNFLMKSQTEIQKELLKKQRVTQIHPSTERHPRQLGNCFPPFGAEKNLDKRTVNIISTQSIGDHSEGTHSETVDNRGRTNTAIRAKQQLKNLLDIPIEPFHKGKKQEFNKLKSFKTMYVGKKNFQSQYESEKDEFEIIKEKVEEKKAKFAQLKNDARKILEDDF